MFGKAAGGEREEEGEGREKEGEGGEEVGILTSNNFSRDIFRFRITRQQRLLINARMSRYIQIEQN